MNRARCGWANPANPLYLQYHDEEWGTPCQDENRLFEMLNLEGAQAGLAWETVLNKRANYRLAFDDWDANRIARYDAQRVAVLLANPGIIRNRLKIHATINNAQAYLRLCDDVGGLVPYLWGTVGGRPIQNSPATAKDCPATTPLSDALSDDLRRRGFKFVGSTIIYAYLQAMGIVNDHCQTCFRFHAKTSA